MLTYYYEKTKKEVRSTIERIIYGDVLMVINFSMDFLALYVTAKIMHVKLSPKKMTVSAVFGAIYSLAVLAIDQNSFICGALSLAIAFLLTYVAYGKQKPKILLKNTAVFYVVNFALGGGVTAICNLLNVWQNKRNIMINGTFDTVYGDIPFGLLTALGGICGIISLISGKIIKKKYAQKECLLEIQLNGEKTVLESLVDSGNLLKEPISGKPVIIAAFEGVRRIIPVELLPLFKTKDLSLLSHNGFISKIRIIPASTVNGKSVLYALLPDKTTVDGKEVDVYIAITTDTNTFGGFPAVVPTEITQ